MIAFCVQTNSSPHSPKLYPAQTFPVIYALDSGYGQAGPAARHMAASGGMASAYVVSVGYKPTDYGKRMDDLTFRPVVFMGGKSAGGAEAFATFLIDELRPLIQATYPTADHRRAILIGHSASGLFGANILARRPGAFSGFVLGSPSFWLEPEDMARVRQAKDGGERVLIYAGGKEEAETTEAAADLDRALKGRVRTELKVYPGANHASYYIQMLTDALPRLLPTQQDPKAPPHRLLSAAEVARLAGAYRLDDGRTITFRGQHGFLWGLMPGVPLAFIREGPGRFYAVGLDTTAGFEGDRVILRPPGAELRGTRVPSAPGT